MTDSNGISKLYTLKELAEIIKVTERTLYTYVKNGRLEGVKIGGKGKIVWRAGCSGLSTARDRLMSVNNH